MAPTEGTELRLQVDEQTGEVQSVMLAGADGALELRAFAAPRDGDLWSEVRPQIAADVAQRGGTATEREGRWGTELVCQMQVVLPDGTQAMQPSRVVGINGPRWMLRATFLGQPAVQPDDAQAWEDTLAAVVVHRGAHAMPVGDPLPLTLPATSSASSSPEPGSTTRPNHDRARNDLGWRHGREEQAAAHHQPVGEPGRPARTRPARDHAQGRVQPDRRRARPRAGPTARHAATVTLRPRGGVPALEAELYDGTGSIMLVWLGRRRIAGISPGRSIEVEGRIGQHDGDRIIYNPRYELLP